MDDERIPPQVEIFFSRYRQAIEAYDAHRLATFWGFPCMAISDDFVGTFASAEELRASLAQAYAIYQQYGLTRVAYTIKKYEKVSQSLVRVRLTWDYYGKDDRYLISTDNVYLLRQEGEEYRAYITIPLDETEKMAELRRLTP
jgi:hypothetical protein